MSYIEKRAVVKNLLEDISQQYGKELELCRRKLKLVLEIKALEKEQEELLDKCVRILMELCELRVKFAVCKFGPSLKNDPELAKAKFDVENLMAQ